MSYPNPATCPHPARGLHFWFYDRHINPGSSLVYAEKWCGCTVCKATWFMSRWASKRWRRPLVTK